MENLPKNPPDVVAPSLHSPSTGTRVTEDVQEETSKPSDSGRSLTTLFEDQNQNRVKGEIRIEVDPSAHPLTSTPSPNSPKNNDSFICENALRFFPSSDKDIDLLKNIRKVFITRADDGGSSYKVATETGDTLFESAQGETEGSIWTRYFRQQQKILLLKDKFQRGILKLDFGRSRTVSCCQTLRFAAMTAHFKSKSEEPLCIIFKDHGCCIYSCCFSGVTYETVPQLDAIHPFTVKTKRQWRNRAEFMVKHSDGSILAFIDKEKKFYALTMGENLKPMMKAALIGFVISMDVMDREDAGKLNCYLRPSTYGAILFLLMLCFMIGAFLYHFITAMILAWPRGATLGCTDQVHPNLDQGFDSMYPTSMTPSTINLTQAANTTE